MAVAIFIFVIDIATKEAVFRTFALRESMALTSFLNLGHWLNPGAAFSFLSDAGGWQRYLFSALAVAVIVWLGAGMLFNDALTKTLRTAFALIVGGAAGNLYDRIARGAVIDWIDLHWAGWHWPVFNLADCAIVAGAITLASAQVPNTSKNEKSAMQN
ncbi:signal peptidase II [Noviherbaspirillum sp. CPCC 100848]|uniref:Lipoprotein signal peptidase n=1 Tax=Noviherbaspirillum album TaxID=3080276 RepID=A0ABU6J878_9BURK|nr:signal peptidase II [Noviherbaspirillum sp. CPCC 100848]